MKNILFVCTGNICRSAMAEYIMRAYCASKGLGRKFRARSAGIYASDGLDMTDEAARALKILKIKVRKKHSSRLLRLQAALDADLIVCMTRGHKDAVLSAGRLPDGAADKIKTVAELTGGADVDDPYGCGVDVYVKTGERLIAAMERIVGAASERGKSG